jgi:hypothetical protein
MCIRASRHINQRPKLPVIPPTASGSGFIPAVWKASSSTKTDALKAIKTLVPAALINDAVGIAELPPRKAQSLIAQQHDVVGIEFGWAYVAKLIRS